MLQTVMRFSIEKPRTTSPAYSTTWPTPPATPAWPMSAEDRVLRRHAGGQLALERDAHRLRPRLRQRLRREHVLDLGGADPERERAERAVRRVWLSPQTIVMPGCVTPSSGPITWTIPSRPLPVA